MRGTPGTQIEVSLRAVKWQSVAVLDFDHSPPASDANQPPPGPSGPSGPTGSGPANAGSVVVGATPGGSVAINATATTAGPGAAVNTPTTATTNAPGDNSPTGADSGAVLGALTAAARRAPLAPRLRPGGVADPFDPLDPVDPVDPIPVPSLPVEVIVSRRDGPEVHRETLRAATGSPSPAGFTVGDISGNDVIDVTFVNHNDVPVVLRSCTVVASRRIQAATTRVSNELLLRAFNGAVRSLSPTIEASDGKLIISLHGDLADELKLNNIIFDVPDSFSGGAIFDAADLEIMGLSELVPRVVARLRADLLAPMTGVLGTAKPEDRTWVQERIVAVRDAAFIDAVVDAYFDASATGSVVGARLASLVAGDSTRLVASTLRGIAGVVLLSYPFLTDAHDHEPADVALAASYALTEIHGEFGAIGIELDEVRASLFLAFHHGRVTVEAPDGDLPHDALEVGTIVPTAHLGFDVSHSDVDVDAPLWLDLVSLGTVTLGAFLLEQGLEELVDFLGRTAEREIPAAFHQFMADHAEAYGHLVARALTTVADREHHFHRAAANRDQIAIATINPNQLLVPHDPTKLVKPSPVKGIEQNLPPVRPIDEPQDAPLNAILGATPEQLLDRIDHFVFVMMENRSFDHMLGHLSHPDFGGRADVDGLDGSARELGGDFTGTQATPLPGPQPAFWPNLPHDHRSIVRQINDGGMNGFASEYGRKLMRHHGVVRESLINDAERALRFETPDAVETYARLAAEYAVCDRWFSAVPAGTFPNRSCYYSGVTPGLENEEIEPDFGYLDQVTLFDVLTDAGVDWKVFESGISFLRTFDRYRVDTEAIRPLTELGDPMPTVTFIDPSFTGFPSPIPNNDDQPDTHIRAGQAFIGDIVRRVEQSSHWDTTMLVIMYDEHGGFADHVPPPGAPGSSHPPDGPVTISRSHPDATTYGVRVPAFVVSPLVARGSVAHQIFDHAAVFKTLVQRFAPEHVNSAILPERVRRSRHLGEVLTDSPPRVASPRRPSVPTVMASRRRRARFTFDEPLDIEDAAGVLLAIARPQSRETRRH